MAEALNDILEPSANKWNSNVIKSIEHGGQISGLLVKVNSLALVLATHRTKIGDLDRKDLEIERSHQFEALLKTLHGHSLQLLFCSSV